MTYIVKPTVHLAFGAAATALAASVLAFDFPYYAIVAAAALIGVFAVWLTLTIRGIRTRESSS
ncbi:membrane protein implicated in regulation of membrane protease activity [Nocardiopsis arvandica]|uniref:Membrane protein implicated in regulation of membrane protease activity n=1 Tax=Nocardiopsis sinuspersici TaxID=501010 RepID=A0A7Y9XG39_9ACTN|nr:hypothetical protein [Nocardiopsis sinuspersici]NYH53893.1 membrane protein implicated in regulation of membrane protease activity [Nocardiopsis sinuspersici]